MPPNDAWPKHHRCRGATGYTATLGIMPRIDGAPTPAEDAPVVEPTKAAEPKAEPKPITKATLGIAAGPKKASGLLLKAKAEAEAEEEAADGNPETAPKAYTGEDDGADDEVENSMASSSRDDEPPMNETVKTADAPPPRSIFSKAKAG